MGRELPPDEVPGAWTQRVTAWARRTASGRAGGRHGRDLRARAYLDLLLGKDSRPAGQDQDSTPAARHRAAFAGAGQC